MINNFGSPHKFWLLTLLVAVASSASIESAPVDEALLKESSSVFICSIEDSGFLKKLCVIVDSGIVDRIAKAIIAPGQEGGPKISLEPGPVVIFCGDDMAPKVAFIYRLDGWISQHKITIEDGKWRIDNARLSPELIAPSLDGNGNIIEDIWRYHLGKYKPR